MKTSYLGTTIPFIAAIFLAAPPASANYIPVPTPRPDFVKDIGKLNEIKPDMPRTIVATDVEPDMEPTTGIIATVYVDALTSYLSGTGEEVATLPEVRQSLEAASNKPLSIEIIETVNAQLSEENGELAALIESYDGGSEKLAEDIFYAKGTTAASLQ